MTLRDDLRGVRPLDAICAVLIVPVAAVGISLGINNQTRETQETQVPAQETQVQDAGDAYTDTWAWCQQRFPYRTDLQEACRWGAYEMLPGQDSMPAIPSVPTYEKGQKDA
jgi:hypothetical protein